MSHRAPVPFAPVPPLAVGGALGAGMRWAALELVPDASAWVPVPTVVANVAGCLLLGLVWDGPPSPRRQLLVGVAGGSTTLSTLSLELAWHLDAGDITAAGVYLAVSLLVGVAGFRIGRQLA